MNNEMKPTSNLTIFQQTLSTFAEHMGKSGATRELKKTGGGNTTSEVFKNMRAEVEKANKGDLQTLNQLKQKYDEIKAREPQDSSKSSVLYKTNQFSKMCFSKSYTREVVKARREFEQLGEAIQKRLQELEQNPPKPAQKNEQLQKVQTSLRSFAGVVGQPGATTILKEDFDAKSTKDVFDQMLSTLNNAKPEPDLETLLNLKATMDAIAEKEILQKPGSSVLNRTTSLHKNEQIESTRYSFDKLNKEISTRIEAKEVKTVEREKIEGGPDLKTIEASFSAFANNVGKKGALEAFTKFLGVKTIEEAFKKLDSLIDASKPASDEELADHQQLLAKINQSYDKIYNAEAGASQQGSSVLMPENFKTQQCLSNKGSKEDFISTFSKLEKTIFVKIDEAGIQQEFQKAGVTSSKLNDCKVKFKEISDENPEKYFDEDVAKFRQSEKFKTFISDANVEYNKCATKEAKLAKLKELVMEASGLYEAHLNEERLRGNPSKDLKHMAEDDKLPLTMALILEMDISPELIAYVQPRLEEKFGFNANFLNNITAAMVQIVKTVTLEEGTSKA